MAKQTQEKHDLETCLKQYRELVAEVEETKATDRFGFYRDRAGLWQRQRGPEFQEVRQRRKDVSKAFTKYIDSKTMSAGFS